MVFRFLIISMLFLVQSAYAATELRDIRFSELPGDRVEIRAAFSEKPVVPKGYAIEKPARIVLDFPGVKSVLDRKKYSLGLGNLKSAVILTANDRTRFILNLSAPAGHSTTIEGNELVAIIDNSQVADNTFVRSQKQVVSVSNPATKKSSFSKLNAVLDVDFRREESGAGKVLLKLSDPKVSVDVEQSSKGINVSFAKTSVSDALQRRLDVIDFATPVTFIETKSDDDQVKISIEVKDRYEYLAYQTDESYVISVSPLSQAQIEEQKSKFKYVGEKLSLNFQDIEVRKVLEIIADFTDLNLVASDTVSGNITLRLDNVPWDQALELVLKSKGLDKREAGNVLLVAPAAEIAERERQELESRKQLQELEPLVTEFILIRYAKADNILNLITGSAAAVDAANSDGATASPESTLTTVLSSRGSAVVDERTNAIILTDIEANIEGIKSLIEKVDIPVRQVMIEARIVSADDDFTKELGFALTGSQDADLTVSRKLGGNLTTSVPTASAAAGTFSLTYLPGDMNLNLEITALETAGYGEVISQPRVLTGDKQTAKIESGQQVPFTSSDGDTVTTIFQDAVLSLEVTPQITPDNRIIMELKINRDSLDTGTVTASGSPINVTELTTTALVGDGDTIVLGGIFEQTKSVGESKVPLLGDIPLLGRLFRNNVDVDNRSELLIFITPRILTDSILDQ